MDANIPENSNVEQVPELLDQIDDEIENALDGEVVDEPNEDTVKSWVNSVSSAHNELSNIMMDIAHGQGDIDTLIEDAAEEVIENVVAPFYREVVDEIAGYESRTAIFGTLNYFSPEEPLSIELAVELGSEFDYPDVRDVKNRYETVLEYGRSIKESEKENSPDWSNTTNSPADVD